MSRLPTLHRHSGQSPTPSTPTPAATPHNDKENVQPPPHQSGLSYNTVQYFIAYCSVFNLAVICSLAILFACHKHSLYLYGAALGVITFWMSYVVGSVLMWIMGRMVWISLVCGLFFCFLFWAGNRNANGFSFLCMVRSWGVFACWWGYGLRVMELLCH
jgi:hypothetical protein